MSTENTVNGLPESAPSSGADIMNDPQYVTNTGSGEDGTGDADTCRICRGEATEQEPLFYPCKCSGSIKFVHQDCLMEWLSHSQKKYCELCKTPFRFTKLYSPNMPQTLPTHVFFRHLIIHTIKNLAVWLRFCLVVFVWLGCLPWAMRHIWGFLFWFGDGGWNSKTIGLNSPYNDTSTARALEAMASGLAGSVFNETVPNGTSPANPLMTVPTTPKTVGKVIGQTPELLKPIMKFFKMSRHDRVPVGFFKAIFRGLNLPPPELNITSTTQHASPLQSAIPGRSSLLSEIPFLKGLTRYQRFNSIIITTLEGQIITIVVVVCFVLVFLIREWVVQQQPGINMGVGFNAEFGGERGARNRNVLPDNAPDAEGLPANAARNAEELQRAIPRQAVDVGARPIARPRRRMVRFEDTHGNDAEPTNGNGEAPSNQQLNLIQMEGDRAGEGPVDGDHRRPGLLGRDALSPAAEIQRHLTDESSKAHDGFDVGEFVSVWRRANGSPEEVLRIIEAEGLGEKLSYWKNAMEGLQANSAPASSSDGPNALIGSTSPHGSTDSLAAQHSDGTNSTNESWIDVTSLPSIDKENGDSNSAQDDIFGKAAVASIKGKEKVVDTLTGPLSDASNKIASNYHAIPSNQLPLNEETSWAANPTPPPGIIFQSGPGRPRVVSDGPQPQESLSPLPEKYWSFSGIPGSSSTARDANFALVAEEHRMENRGLKLNKDRYSRQETSSNQAQDPGLVEVSSIDESEIVSQDTSELIEIYNIETDVTRTVRSWDEEFANNPVHSDSEDDFQEIPTNEGDVEQNPFHPDGLLPEDLAAFETRDPAPQRRPEPQGFLGHIANFLWGDLNVPQDGRAGDDEHIVQDLAAEPPFVPVAHHNHGIFDDADSDDGGEANQDRDIMAAAAAAGIDPNDPDGLDDVEDFEGIMELIGMRGPLTALVQNGLFSAVLISLTVACGVWVPYNVGRLVLLLIANPIATVKLPLKFLFSFAAVLQDLVLVAIGTLSYMLVHLCSLPGLLYLYTTAGPASTTSIIERPGTATESLRFATAAGKRIVDGFVNALVQIPDSEVPAFSALSHESLIYIKTVIPESLQYIGSFVTSILGNPSAESPLNKSANFTAVWPAVSEFGINVGRSLRAMPKVLGTAESWVITLDIPERTVPVDPSLSYWSGTDRFWAILAGYIAFSFLGAAYLKRGSPFSTSQTGREWEATIIDVLNQAGGVMKVILIISIEMLVFPLYCGLLLDLALLPLFEKASLHSRALFTIETPLTSIFVHWFVGTCYMFHFALFVSMCRKIMRSGVLYFIRDPDDPTFHPVRDVLERNVATQLRKILFSAMVYGALVVVCLGGVVWGLALAFQGVLPIHWSSNEPVLEFPIDLLFYNFFMPLAVKFFKPSDGLHAMYTWWFRKCARILRLTWFLFDERMVDEEGHHVRRSWGDFLRGVKGDVTKPLKSDPASDPFQEDSELRAYFLRDGRYVRVPASDQVRIPKGAQVFLEVDESNSRIDGRGEVDDGLHGRASELFKMVYIPPYFRGRIFLFILSIWLFAAVTGVCITIVPLVFGRQIFARIIPPHVRKNDVYAFSIGIYILGSVLYCIMHIQKGVDYIRSTFAIDADTPAKVMRQVSSICLRVLRVIYAYTAFAIVLPSLFALAVEFYFIVPLHTYFAPSEPHVIHFVQSWTLGLLYVKLTTRFILWHADSRPAEALRAVTQKGYLDPDIRIATRAFIFPATMVLLTALIVPFYLACLANRFEIFGSEAEQRLLVFRYAYPFCLSWVINATGLWLLLGVMKCWRLRIRDEVYLIGERLHNFGDRNKSGTAALIPVGNRIET